LYWLLSCGLKFFTYGCQQLPTAPQTMPGRAALQAELGL
jgi:hypothetical protein